MAIAFLLQDCQKSDSSVIDSLGSAPVILNATISPSTINLDTIPQSTTTLQFMANARITHQDGLSDISAVNYLLVDESNVTTLAAGSLLDDGVKPDQAAGDSNFTAQISISVQNLPVGNYFCQIVARDRSGLTSNTYILAITIVRQINHPPVLSDLQTPDTIVLAGQSQQFKLTVRATDPDGKSDIAKVYFNSFKPNGTAASGNPFLMYDDGSENIVIQPDFTSGDAAKGDSIYTLTVFITPTDQQGNSTALGPYRFEFQASDRSNALSQKLIKIIQVVQ